MTFDPNHDKHLRELERELHRAHTITPGLMADLIARACPCLQSRHRAATARIIRLIESGAFADATLALLELELPQWKLRRLIREDDEVALRNFETARASRRARRHGRSQPRKPVAGDPDRIGRSAVSQSHCG